MPLTARIRPRRSASTAAASAPAPSGDDRAVGVAARPAAGRTTGQALGWAWNRRSAGSSYSAWQAGHIVNPAIVVAGRS